MLFKSTLYEYCKCKKSTRFLSTHSTQTSLAPERAGNLDLELFSGDAKQRKQETWRRKILVCEFSFIFCFLGHYFHAVGYVSFKRINICAILKDNSLMRSCHKLKHEFFAARCELRRCVLQAFADASSPRAFRQNIHPLIHILRSS